jgi:DNA-binding MarR family transcriptional regulator
MPAEDRRAPRGCTNFKLRQLTRRVSRHYDRVVATCGLKTTQYSLLSHIARLAPVRPSDLAAAMAMDASTLTRNLQPLLEHGWAAIGPGNDGRSRLVTLTAKGRAKRGEAQRAWKRAQLALNEQLGSDRVAELHALLDDCMAALAAAPGETIDG